MVLWKSDLTDKIKRRFFPAAVVSILLYGCTTWTLTKHIEKKLDGNYTGMLRAMWNWSWRQQPTKQLMYGHLPPITKTILVRRSRYAEPYSFTYYANKSKLYFLQKFNDDILFLGLKPSPHTPTHRYTPTYTQIHTHIHTHSNTHTHTHTHIHTHRYIHTQRYTHTHTHTDTHTHTHKYIKKQIIFFLVYLFQFLSIQEKTSVYRTAYVS